MKKTTRSQAKIFLLVCGLLLAISGSPGQVFLGIRGLPLVPGIFRSLGIAHPPSAVPVRPGARPAEVRSASREDRQKLNRPGISPSVRFERRREAARQTWVRQFFGPMDSSYVERGYLCPLADGAYLWAGDAAAFTPYERGLAALKLTSDGQIVWQRVYLGPPPPWQYVSSVAGTADGGAIIGATAGTTGAMDLRAIKLAADGNLEWARSYDVDGGNEVFGGLGQTADGGYLLTGSMHRSTADAMTPVAIRLAGNGDVVWQRTYARTDRPTGIEIGGFHETPDGGFIVRAASPGSYSGDPWDLIFLKLTSAGEPEWEKAYAMNAAWRGYGTVWRDILSTSDGGFVLSSRLSDVYSAEDIEIVKLDAACDVEWRKALRSARSERATEVRETADGSFLGVGQIWVDDVGWHVLLFKLSPAGDIEWQRMIGAQSAWEIFSAGTSAYQTPDGDYLIAAGEGALIKMSAGGTIEKLGDIVKTTDLVASDIAPGPRSVSVVSGPVMINPNEAALYPRDVPITAGLVFAPPLDLAAETLLNRSLAQAEYYVELSWGLNPLNDDIEIVSYLIDYMAYEPDGSGSGVSLVPVGGNQLAYRDLALWPERMYVYTLRAVGSDGGRSLPAELTYWPEIWSRR